MRIKFLIPFLIIISLGCSDDLKVLEERIKIQADKNNTEMSIIDIKKNCSLFKRMGKRGLLPRRYRQVS